jgi:hypothetical protein
MEYKGRIALILGDYFGVFLDNGPSNTTNGFSFSYKVVPFTGNFPTLSFGW